MTGPEGGFALGGTFFFLVFGLDLSFGGASLELLGTGAGTGGWAGELCTCGVSCEDTVVSGDSDT